MHRLSSWPRKNRSKGRATSLLINELRKMLNGVGGGVTQHTPRRSPSGIQIKQHDCWLKRTSRYEESLALRGRLR